MKKLIIIGSIAVVIIALIIFRIYSILYLPILNNDMKYSWIFQDSIQKNIKFIKSCGNRNDTFYVYDFKDDIEFTIWEISNLNEVNINKIQIEQNSKINKSNINPYRMIDCSNLVMKSRLSFSGNNLIIRLDTSSTVLNDECYNNHRIINMKINEIEIVNQHNKCQMKLSKVGSATNISIAYTKVNNTLMFILANSLTNNQLKNFSLHSYLRL